MTAAMADARPARRTPRWLIAVLAISLLLNGLVFGAIGARWWALQHGPPPWIGTSDNSHLFGLAFTLPRDRYREIRQQVEAERAAMRPLRQKRWDAREELRQVLLADPFDAAKFSDIQKRLFDSEQETRLGTLKVVAAIMQRLTPEERKALAEWELNDRTKRREFWRKMRERDKRN
jgi:Spy/CpxP family protein refolding chaperone